MRFLFVIAALVIVSAAFAEDFVAVNSNDGRDVLSGVYYANVRGIPVRFMPVPGGDPEIFSAKAGSGHSILLIQSSTPVSGFVESSLEGNNNTVEIYASQDGARTNLELAKKSGASSFIIVDSAYSDSAISVISYAALTKSYVLLADKGNIAEVKDIVGGKKVTIYGLVDSEVKEALAPLSPETIGNGEDKFADNIELARRVMDGYGIDRAIISDGSLLEESIAKGDQPVIFSGRLVPQVTYDFIKQRVAQGKFSGAMLIGTDLIVPIHDMRERMEKEFISAGQNRTFGITVKFAQVVPSAGTGVLTLDTFSMPAYSPSLEILDVAYNKESGKVMVALNNTGEGAAYYSAEIRIRANGNEIRVLGGNETLLVERGAQAGIEYPLDLSSVSEGNITAGVLVKYGATKSSLESFVSKDGPLASIAYVDHSNITVQSARYDKDNQRVVVTIRNAGNGTAYVFSRLSLILDGSPANITSSGTRTMEAGSLVVEEFPLELKEADLGKNSNVTVFVDYGGRPGFLAKKAAYVVSLERSSELPLLLIAIGMIIVIAIAYFMLGRREGKK